MTVGSLFSGVGGFDLGLERAGHRVVWQVEADARCRSVLRRHWPMADIYEDVCDVGESNLAPVDLICGGFPCQDLSVAGRRAGLDGERSGLWFEFRRIVAELRPTWVLVENVPGLRSSDGGRDLATVLRGMAGLGYVGAWRSVDSEYFGLAQRRERIFLLACRDPRAGCPAEVLALAEGMSGHPAPSREAGQVVANALANGSGKKGGPDDNAAQGHHLVAHTLRAEGFDASEDGTGRGVPLVADPICANEQRTYTHEGTRNVMLQAYRKAQKAHDPDDCERWEEAEHTNTLAGHGTTTSEAMLAETLSVGADQTTGFPGDIAPATVPRRLTPTECERLQGFPDDWTRWAADGSELADSPRYRMLGNAVSVPVAEWIGHRLRTPPASEHAPQRSPRT